MKGIRRVVLGAVMGLGFLLIAGGAAWAVDADAWVKGLNGFNGAMAKGDVKGLASGWAKDGVRHHPLMGDIVGPEGNEKFFQGIYDGFKDQTLTVHRHWSKGDTIVVEWTWAATDRKSGKPVKLDELVVIQVAADGKIKDLRQYFDTAGLLKQLE